MSKQPDDGALPSCPSPPLPSPPPPSPPTPPSRVSGVYHLWYQGYDCSASFGGSLFGLENLTLAECAAACDANASVCAGFVRNVDSGACWSRSLDCINPASRLPLTRYDNCDAWQIYLYPQPPSPSPSRSCPSDSSFAFLKETIPRIFFILGCTAAGLLFIGRVIIICRRRMQRRAIAASSTEIELGSWPAPGAAVPGAQHSQPAEPPWAPGSDRLDNKCILCIDEARCMALVPCGHAVLCVTCAELVMQEQPRTCPICRAHPTQAIRLFG